MSDCIRCGQPVTPGQFYQYAQRDPVDLADLVTSTANESPGGLLYLWKTDHVFHVDCPDAVPEHDCRIDVFNPGGVRVTHIPSGITVFIPKELEPSTIKAKNAALAEIKRRLDEKGL